MTSATRKHTLTEGAYKLFFGASAFRCCLSLASMLDTSRRRTVLFGLLIFSSFQVTQAQFHNFQLREKNVGYIRNADFEELGSNSFSYKKSLPTMENIIETLAIDGNILANLTMDCAEDVGLIVDGAMSLFGGPESNFTIVALQFVDSSGKPGAGILLGNAKWYGLFKECQAIQYDLGNRTLAGNYHHVNFVIGGANETTCASTSTMTIDLCLPKTCSSDDVQTLVDGLAKKEVVCSIQSLPREANANVGTWITLAIIAVVLFLGVTASIYDYFVLPYHKKEPYANSLLMQCWRSFSLYTNVVEIFNTKGANKPGNIGPIHCMRFFSMCWVVMGHAMIFYLELSINPASFVDMQKHRIFGIINNSFFSVDTFFWQSGLLLTFVWLKKYRQNKRQVMSPQAWILFYVHRIVRLSPAYFLVIAFYTFIYVPFGTKNMALNAEWSTDTCHKNWWINFLYINNFVRFKEQCYGVSWYLAADMQMFIFTPLILIPLAINKLYGVLVAVLILALSTGAHVVTMYHYYFPPTVGAFTGGKDPRTIGDDSTYMVMMYAAPWIRCQVYIVGMLTGVLLQSVKKLRIPSLILALGWIMTLAIAYGCLFTLKGYFNGDVVPMGWRTLFSAASKPMWGVALSWIVIACYYGYGSFINSFMSWTIWVPVGRLSYATYLIHIIVVNYLIGQNQQPFVLSNFFQMFAMYIIPMIFCSLVFALFWSSAFELGFGKLETILINALIQSKPKPMPVRPRASTFDPPVPETPPTKHHHSPAEANRKSISKEIAVEASDLVHRRQQTIATIEIPPLESNGNLKSRKSDDDDDRWS